MSDDRDPDKIADEHGGPIDVTELSIGELSAMVNGSNLERALDHILAVGKNNTGFHGFNNVI